MHSFPLYVRGINVGHCHSHYPLFRCCLEHVFSFVLPQVFKPRTPPEAITLCSRLLEYTPATRFSPFEACSHAFFDELRQPNARLPNGRELPQLFNFSPTGSEMFAFEQLCDSKMSWNDTEHSLAATICLSPNICFWFTELSIQPQLNSILIPPHARSYTTTSSRGETQLSLNANLFRLFSNNDDGKPFGWWKAQTKTHFYVPDAQSYSIKCSVSYIGYLGSWGMHAQIFIQPTVMLTTTACQTSCNWWIYCLLYSFLLLS